MDFCVHEPRYRFLIVENWSCFDAAQAMLLDLAQMQSLNVGGGVMIMVLLIQCACRNWGVAR